MPIVQPLKDSEEKQTRVGRFNGEASADDFGEGAMRRGNAAVVQGLNSAMRFAQETDNAIAEADALELDNEFSRFVRERLYGPEGYTTSLGRNALERREQAQQEIEQRFRDIQGRASGGRSRTMFQRSGQARLDDAISTIDRHYGGQAQVFRRTQFEGRIAEAANNAVAAYQDPEMVGAQINTIIGETERQAQVEGWSDETRTAMIRDRASGVWAQVIMRTADADPQRASEMFEQRRGSMSAGDVSQVMERLGQRMLAARARTEVDRLVTESEGSVQRFMSLADGIEDTTFRDEVIQRGLARFQQIEAAETLDVENAQERALSAYERGGADAVAPNDRALLVREGRWNGIVSSFQARASTGVTAATQTSEALADSLQALHAEDPRAFELAMNLVRGARLGEGVTPDMVRRATGFTLEDLQQMRSRMNADDWRRVVEIQNGQASADNEAITRAYTTIRNIAYPRAAALGVQLSGDNNVQRRGQFDQFLMAEARAFMRANNGRQPSDADVDAIINRALMRGRGMMGGQAAIGPRAFEWQPGDRGRRVSWDDIPRAEQRVQTEAWYESQLHGAPRAQWDAIPEADQASGVAAWRRAHPNEQGSEAEIRAWVERRYSYTRAHPNAPAQSRDIREWGERRYGESLQRY